MDIERVSKKLKQLMEAKRFLEAVYEAVRESSAQAVSFNKMDWLRIQKRPSKLSVAIDTAIHAHREKRPKTGDIIAWVRHFFNPNGNPDSIRSMLSVKKRAGLYTQNERGEWSSKRESYDNSFGDI